ncbi:general transcription factor II-I repeat domain-containing protein 1 [Platysternon megacephalum]|uniref:General transcription factor II-I repeat domain-containing protein 1 n=1 Tax=Platysternon megacephalum TaxID=55544 RepID=A0A4D9F2C0_9SAUR|nr:general transcription factor II-I repeat domain-containing protein 1 [Platysternon megacephalum]
MKPLSGPRLLHFALRSKGRLADQRAGAGEIPVTQISRRQLPYLGREGDGPSALFGTSDGMGGSPPASRAYAMPWCPAYTMLFPACPLQCPLLARAGIKSMPCMARCLSVLPRLSSTSVPFPAVTAFTLPMNY